MADVTPEEIEWLRSQLHDPAMKCRQCDLTRLVLAADLETAWDEGWEAGGAFGGGEPQSANPYRVADEGATRLTGPVFLPGDVVYSPGEE